jgi:hypothetical protein
MDLSLDWVTTDGFALFQLHQYWMPAKKIQEETAFSAALELLLDDTPEPLVPLTTDHSPLTPIQ